MTRDSRLLSFCVRMLVLTAVLPGGRSFCRQPAASLQFPGTKILFGANELAVVEPDVTFFGFPT